jgi:hypothetical protein
MIRALTTTSPPAAQVAAVRPVGQVPWRIGRSSRRRRLCDYAPIQFNI